MSIEHDIRAERVAHLDLSAYTAVSSGPPVRAVVAQMRTAGRNCAFVVKDGALVGIFTDRDVLRRVVDAPQVWDVPIDQVMTPAPLSIKPEAAAAEALRLMDTQGFRNMPVVDGQGRIVGNLTHFSLIKFLSDHFAEQVYNLPPNPEQLAQRRHGA